VSAPAAAVVDSAKPAAKADAYDSAATLLARVLEFDLNRDGAIDHRDAAEAARVGKSLAIEVRLSDGSVETLAGPERLAHAADVLATAVRTQGPQAKVPEAALLEPPGAALSRAVSESWPALVRRTNNVADIVEALKQSNLPAPDGKLHVWVPASDPEALAKLTADARAYNEARAAVAMADGKPPPTDTLEV